MKGIFFVSFFFLILSAFGQDKILLTNSREIENVKVIDLTANTIKYFKFGSDSSKTKAIYREDVFAIVGSDGSEKVIYMPDPAEGEFSIEQMRMFVKGTKDARLHYHDLSSTLIGFAFGAVGPYFYSQVGISPGFVVLPPAVGVFLVSLASPNVRHEKYVEAKYYNNEEYMMGFERKGRRRKIRNAFLGSLVGMGLGAIPVLMTIK